MSVGGATGNTGFVVGAAGGADPVGTGPQSNGDGGPLLRGVTPEKALGGAFAGGIVAAFLVRWLRS